MKYAISACLLGENCKYNGGNNYRAALVEFLKDKEYIVVCPEVYGGMTTPRLPSEQKGNKVFNSLHEDVTKYFEKGTRLAFSKVKEAKVDIFVGMSRSPSCGVNEVYDGTFSKTLIAGDGMFVRKCRENGIEVVDITDFMDAIA